MKKVGMVLGAFCPLHKGHLDLIMRAKKENDLCYIIVCGYDNDRGGELLPLHKRYRYIKQSFINDDLVKVIYINDTELGIDESMSEENWETWCVAVLGKMNQEDVANYKRVWYVAEKSYVTSLNKLNEETIFVDRNLNKISGTMIRNNPIKYWDYICPEFRKVFSHNILITGTASEGKTNLVRDIARYFALPYSEEMGRLRLENTNKVDSELDFGDFHYNLYEQNKVNAENIDSLSNQGIVISDTDNLVTLMYAKQYAEEPNFELNMEDYHALYQIAKQQSKYIKWHKIFVLAPNGEFIDDGSRYMGHSDMESRMKLFNILTELLEDFGYNYEILNHGYYKNYLRVKEYIENERGK